MRANKALAQHFLTDERAIERIVKAISPRSGDAIVEIGPGVGALTAPVLASGARLDAVEIDPALCDRLRARFAQHKTFTLHCRDALEYDFAASGAGDEIRIIGNLPYNVSTPLLMRLFDAAGHFRDLHLMLQTEVAERVAATAGDRKYSRLSVAAGCFTEVQRLFDVPPSAFAPPPRVSSTVIRLLPRPCPIAPALRPAFFDLVKRAFSQRRKTLGRIFAGVLDEADFARLGLSAAARPENLGVRDFLAVVKLLRDRQTTTEPQIEP